MAAPHIKLLGKPNVKIDGQPSAILKSAKGLALLAYLLVTQQAHTREAIADLLWEANSTAKSLNNLRQLLSRLRVWLPDLQISKTEVAYQLEGFVDWAVMIEGLTAVDPHTLDEALQLYQGELLAGLYLPDAPRFNEWLALEREQLARRIMGAYEQLCTTYAQQENWVNGVIAAQRWLSLDELNEVALQYLLQFLAASGQVEVALRQYEISRQRLWAELEVEPDEETSQLVKRLQQLRQKQGGGLSWAAIVGAQVERPSPDQLAEPGALPTNACVPYQRNHDFTGRKELLLCLANLLLPEGEGAEHRAVAVTGMGGLGKTQVAVEFCYRYGRYFPGGVYWLSFADGDNVAEEVAEIGSERGMGLYREADNLRQADKIGRVCKAWQEPIPRLLIFDNCETEDLLAKWLPVTGSCSVLLTSRRADWARELRVVEQPLAVLDDDESVHLLQNLVSDLTITKAADIAKELGYLPLALHLAGSFLRRYRQITADQYLIQLRDKVLLAHPSLKGRGTAFSPTGHELDVARTFAVNWEQLDANNETDAFALKLLASVAQFAPGEPLSLDLLCATVVSDKTDMTQMLSAQDGLVRLVSLGFIKVEGKSMLSMHSLVAAFVQTMLPNVDERSTAVAHTIWQHIQTQWETELVLDRLPVAPAHVRHLMEIELVKTTPQAIHLAHAWGVHLLDIADFVTSRTYLEKALALSEQKFGEDQPQTADVLISLGTLTWKSDSAAAAQPHYERAFAIYEQTFGEDHLKTADSLSNLAITHSRTGNYETAIAHYKCALAIYERLLPPDHPEIARNLLNVGVAYRRLGNYELALSHYEIALSIREATLPADHPHLLESLNNMGLINFLMGNYEAAYRFHRRTLAGRQKRLGLTHPQTSSSLGYMGATLGFLGEYEQALDYLQQSLAIRESIYGAVHPRLVYALTWLGYTLQTKGDMDTARNYLERGLSIQKTNGIENEQTAETLTILADVLMQIDEYETAKHHLEQAMVIWQRGTGLEHRVAAKTLISWGKWHEAQSEKETARSYYERAVANLAGHVVNTHADLIRAQTQLQRLVAKER